MMKCNIIAPVSGAYPLTEDADPNAKRGQREMTDSEVDGDFERPCERNQTKPMLKDRNRKSKKNPVQSVSVAKYSK